MVSLKDIKHSIFFAKKTFQITNIMRIVSASKLSKFKKEKYIFKKYMLKINFIFKNIFLNKNFYKIKNLEYLYLLNKRNNGKKAFVIITTNKKMVGNYNNILLYKILNILNNIKKENYFLIVIGKVGFDFLKNKKININYYFENINENFSFFNIKKFVFNILNIYKKNKISEINFIFQKYIGLLKYEICIKKILPIIINKFNNNDKEIIEYILEPKKEDIINYLLLHYFENLIYDIILNVKISENYARMFTMKKASDNSKKIINDLIISYNKIRQNIITQEILEITKF